MNFIIDPKTNEKKSIFTLSGKELLKKFIKTFNLFVGIRDRRCKRINNLYYKDPAIWTVQEFKDNCERRTCRFDDKRNNIDIIKNREKNLYNMIKRFSCKSIIKNVKLSEKDKKEAKYALLEPHYQILEQNNCNICIKKTAEESASKTKKSSKKSSKNRSKKSSSSSYKDICSESSIESQLISVVSIQ